MIFKLSLAFLAAVVVWLIYIFNSLVKKRNLVNNAWSDIDVQLKRRYDLIPNLVEAVKGYMGHEKSLLVQLTEARSKAMSSSGSSADIAQRAQAENALSATLKSLFAVVENYPQLRASENFQQLQNQLVSLESDIQSARRFFNAAVRDMNNSTQTFPSNMVAGFLGFKTFEFFQTQEEERSAVKVAF